MYSKFWWHSIKRAKSISEDHKMCTAIISWYANTKSNSHNTPMTSSQDPKTPWIKDDYLAKNRTGPQKSHQEVCVSPNKNCLDTKVLLQHCGYCSDCDTDLSHVGEIVWTPPQT